MALEWDAALLITEAEAATGLSDWGDESEIPFREGLERMVASFNSESIPRFRPTVAGVAQDRADLLLKLKERLKLVDWRKREPAIAAEQITAPIFVVGLPRSGTTLTHRLLITDPDARFTAHWEVLFPSPPPETATYENDPRIRKAEAWMTGGGLTDDNFGAMHEYGAKLSDECQHVFEYTCQSTYQSARIQKPSFIRWVGECDIRPAYRFHKMLLQHLQFRCPPGSAWILKSPQHLMHLPALLEIYPDARIVVTHRDPRAVVPSLVSIMTTFQKMGMTETDPAGEYEKWLAFLPRGLADVARLCADPAHAHRFAHVHFDDLTADPVGTIRRVRESLGLGYDANIESGLESYMTDNPRAKKGEHKYSLAGFGLDPARVEQAFARYLAQLDGYLRQVAT